MFTVLKGMQGNRLNLVGENTLYPYYALHLSLNSREISPFSALSTLIKLLLMHNIFNESTPRFLI